MEIPDFGEGGVPGKPLEFAQSLTYPAQAGVGMKFVQAAMFCNWMHNGQSDDRESLMDGAYDISTFVERDPDTGYFQDQAAHHPDARYWIPTYNEIFKATYYDPDKNGLGPGWWEYPHSSDELPVFGLPGEGDASRGLSWEVLSPLYGPGVRAGTVPLGVYTEIQSPWGLLDTLGGSSEWAEDWEDGIPRRRMVRRSNNTDLGFDFDRIFQLWSASPVSRSYGLRIASAVRHPADLDRSWSVNFFDVSFFIQRFIAGDFVVDLDADGDLDIDDVIMFIEIMNH